MGLLAPILYMKDKFAEAILTSQKVIDLIGDPDYSTIPAVGLKYHKVYPYAYLPQTIDDAGCYVCYEMTVKNIKTDTISDYYLNVWVLCHTSLIPTENGPRHDLLADAIDEEINHMRGWGIGKVTPIDYEPVSYSLPNYDYVCRSLSYLITDYNFRYGAK